MRLNGAYATICPNVASKSTASNYFAQSVDVGAIRQSGSNLITVNHVRNLSGNDGCTPGGIDLQIQEGNHQTPCLGQMH